MSKCKAILDGDKITNIQVKAKLQAETQPKEKSEQKRSDNSRQVSPATQES